MGYRVFSGVWKSVAGTVVSLLGMVVAWGSDTINGLFVVHIADWNVHLKPFFELGGWVVGFIAGVYTIMYTRRRIRVERLNELREVQAMCGKCLDSTGDPPAFCDVPDEDKPHYCRLKPQSRLGFWRRLWKVLCAR